MFLKLFYLDSTVDYNSSIQFTAGYYNPVPPPSTESINFVTNYNPVPPPSTVPTNFVTNGYTSFIGSTFNVQVCINLKLL